MPNVQFASPVTVTVTVTANAEGKLTVTKITDDKGTTVFSAETNTAVASSLTTQTNTTRKIHISKVDKNAPNTVLNNAVFEILSGGTKMYLQGGKLLDAAAVEGIIEMSVSASGADEAMAAKGIHASFTIGEIDISGFSYDTVYELKEISAPAGYIITDSSTYFKVIRDNTQMYLRLTGQDGTILTGEDGEPVLDNDSAAISENGLSISVKNTPGAELPSAGGPGTTWIYLLGALLLLGCGIALVARRRLDRVE